MGRLSGLSESLSKSSLTMLDDAKTDKLVCQKFVKGLSRLSNELSHTCQNFNLSKWLYQSFVKWIVTDFVKTQLQLVKMTITNVTKFELSVYITIEEASQKLVSI
jgi:hypothetical protein